MCSEDGGRAFVKVVGHPDNDLVWNLKVFPGQQETLMVSNSWSDKVGLYFGRGPMGLQVETPGSEASRS